MTRTLLRKILRDLWQNLSRTLLVVLAIALGVAGVGFVADTYACLSVNIDLNYQAINPPSATLWLDKADENALAVARGFPGISDADKARPPLRCRVEAEPGRWEILLLYVVDDFNSLHVGRFFPETGSWPPVDGQVLIERDALQMIHGEEGQFIKVKALNADVHDIQIVGTVFDPTPDPAWVNNIASGYITPGTLKLLGGAAPIQGIQVTVDRAGKDRAQIVKVAGNLGEALGKQGYKVLRVEVPIPGKYQQTDKINSIFSILGIFGVLSLVLSGFITALLISSLMRQQIRQIGVMKALGAGKHRIMGVYMVMILFLAVPALAVGIALASAVGKGFALSTLEMLNFNVYRGAVPFPAILLQILLGVLIPVLAALVPLYRGSRITVLEAISDYGISTRDFRGSRTDSACTRFKKLPRLLSLSLRNTFRKRGRLVLSLLMLAIGGASFISAMGASDSWNKSIDQSFANINYDIDIRLAMQYPAGAVEKSIGSLPGVRNVEAWGYAMASAYPKYDDGTYGASYAVFAPKNGSAMIHPPVIKGRWLEEDDTNAVVLDTDFMDNSEKLGMPVAVGDDVILNLAGKDIAFHVVGLMDKIGTQSAAYVNYGYFSEATGQQGNALCARVIVVDKTQRDAILPQIDRKLAEDGINVFVIQSLTVSKQLMVNHVVLILSLLVIMSVLTAAVGALGLAASMGLNVVERLREFGIMRSIGAKSGLIIRTVIGEGIVTGVISWVLGVIISIPMTTLIALNTGGFIFPRIMQIVYPIWTPVLWLGIVVLISAAAAFLPALKASRLTVRDVLNYE